MNINNLFFIKNCIFKDKMHLAIKLHKELYILQRKIDQAKLKLTTDIKVN